MSLNDCASVDVSPSQLAQKLEKGEIDFAVGYFPMLSSKNVRQRRVEKQRFACLMRSGHPRRASRLLVKGSRARLP